MSELPTVTAREAITVFEAVGFRVTRINGSHHIMKRDGHRFLLTVPAHGNKPLKKGTLKGLIGDAGMTVDEFRRHL